MTVSVHLVFTLKQSMSEMSKTWTIDAEGVLTIRQGFRKRKGTPDFYARREEIRAIVVEEGVSEIGDGWFNYLNEVREISLPTTLRLIGKSAFASCERLKEVSIPEGIQMLDYAVLANTLIREIVIPESVTEINNSAFYECEHLQKVVLPKTLQSIWEKAFCYCRSLTEIEIPAEVWHITDGVFEGCTNLRRIILHSKAIDSLCWVPEGVELIQETGDDCRH